MRRAHGSIRLIGAAIALVVTGVAGTGCGTQDGAGRAGGKPDGADVARPDGWRPWQTTLTGGERDVSPGEGESNSCTGQGTPDSQLRCMGTEFRGEQLNVRDGKYRPHGRVGSYGDFARHDGLVLTTHTEGWTNHIRAEDEKSGKKRWDHKGSGPVLTKDGVVSAEMTEQHWEPGQDHGEEPPTTDPGGDIIGRDPSTGTEQWRAAVPDDAWCSPLEVTERTVVSCNSDENDRQPITLHRLAEGDGDDRRLERLATVDANADEEGVEPHFIGYDRGSLVFLPTGEKPSWNGGDKEYSKLVRVDVRTGRKTTKQLPDGLRTGSAARLSGGDLHFRRSADGRTKLTAVDARTAERRWETKTSLKQLSAPETSEKLGEVYFADHAGRVLALDRATGEKRWSIDDARASDGGTDTSQLEAPSSVTRVRDVLVVSAGNTVYTADPSRPDAKPEKHEYTLRHEE